MTDIEKALTKFYTDLNYIADNNPDVTQRIKAKIISKSVIEQIKVEKYGN